MRLRDREIKYLLTSVLARSQHILWSHRVTPPIEVCEDNVACCKLSIHQVKIAQRVAVATTLNGNWLTGQRLWLYSGRLHIQL